MQLQLQSFATLVANAAAAVQGSARQLLDLTVGSTLRAVLEANAGIALWMQWLILQVLSLTRAATSTGADLDSWMADFGLTRLPASAATGRVTLSRFTPSTLALIGAGTLLRSADGSQSFIVTTDTTNPAWSASQLSYSLGAGIASVTVPVQAALPGAAGNVQPNTITLLATALPGIDSVTNEAGLVGGLDGESDAALRLRFASFLASRSRATPLSITQAVLSLRQGLNLTIQENQMPDGSYQPGCFVVTVDDGSGTPTSTLLASVAQQIEAVRPLGSLYTVQAPTLITANISLSLTTAEGANHTELAALCAQTITTAVNQLPIGAALPYTRLAQLAYATDAAITNVTSLRLNGLTADLTPSQSGLIRAGLVQVT
jgi:phage-related baseplate assembly protein